MPHCGASPEFLRPTIACEGLRSCKTPLVLSTECHDRVGDGFADQHRKTPRAAISFQAARAGSSTVLSRSSHETTGSMNRQKQRDSHSGQRENVSLRSKILSPSQQAEE